MRDLELRGAGDLLGDEQSGHVAAVGFELYVALLDEAVEALRAAGEERAPSEAPVRLDVDVDAYLPADYIPFEAAKIDVHRRIAGAREPGELRALRDELRDRFGPVPEPVENLLALQRARIELGAAGARDRRGPRRPALDHPARARRGDGRAAARADPRGDLRAAHADALAARRRRARPSAWRDLLELTEALTAALAPETGRGLASLDEVGSRNAADLVSPAGKEGQPRCAARCKPAPPPAQSRKRHRA